MRRGPGILVGLGLILVTAAPVAAAGPLTNRCTNDEDRFSVSYPSDWFINAPAVDEGSPVSACTLFAPFDDIEVLPEATNVPIFLKHESGTVPDQGTPVTIDGRSGKVAETTVNDVAWYVYYAAIDADTRFAGFAFDNGSAPFDESKAVLDAMIATLDLQGGRMPDTAVDGSAARPAPWAAIGSLIVLVALTGWRLRSDLAAMAIWGR
jgi:hypothetical protein